MVFVRTLFLKDTRLVYLADCSSLEECRSALNSRSGVPRDQLIFYSNGKRMGELGSVEVHDTIDACLALPGGKGGFGSMLRALGAQIEKTTNKEACRDLSGRRLRDINEETRLKNYVNNAADREKEKKEKKEAKLNKLRKIVDPKCNGGGKHEFHDPKYNKEREQVTERVHEAMDAVFGRAAAKAGSKSVAAAAAASTATCTSAIGSAAGSSSSPSSSDDGDSRDMHGPSGIKRKAHEKTTSAPSKPKKGLWVGEGLTESDLEDSTDDEEEKVEKK